MDLCNTGILPQHYTEDFHLKYHCHESLKTHTINMYISLNFICNSKPTAVGCNLYNRHPIYIKQNRNNYLFEMKLKGLLIKWCYCSINVYMNDGFKH